MVAARKAAPSKSTGVGWRGKHTLNISRTAGAKGVSSLKKDQLPHLQKNLSLSFTHTHTELPGLKLCASAATPAPRLLGRRPPGKQRTAGFTFHVSIPQKSEESGNNGGRRRAPSPPLTVFFTGQQQSPAAPHWLPGPRRSCSVSRS